MINILTPLFAYGPARAATGGFPYKHPTVAQVDREKLRVKKAKARRCSQSVLVAMPSAVE